VELLLTRESLTADDFPAIRPVVADGAPRGMSRSSRAVDRADDLETPALEHSAGDASSGAS
jgi:hypothetical protein